MLLTLDVGNTNVKLAVFNGDEMIYSWRIAVKHTRTADEFGIMFKNFFSDKGLRLTDIDGVIMSSVVPTMNYTIEHACDFYLHRKPIMVSYEMKLGGLKLAYTNPNQLGADRIANAVAAYTLYGAPLIIVDVGTASTFGAISRDGTFLGGAIAPGITTSVDSLVDNASKLPLIELTKPKTAIGKDTVTNMQIGAIIGFRGLVEGIIDRMKQELGDSDVKVVATGGLTAVIEDNERPFVDVYDRALTLKGLKILYELNCKN